MINDWSNKEKEKIYYKPKNPCLPREIGVAVISQGKSVLQSFNVLFYACFLKQLTVTFLYVISYEAFFKNELSVFVFRRSPLFAAFTKSSGGEKKGGGEKHSPDLQEPIFDLLVAAKGEARGRAVASVSLCSKNIVNWRKSVSM